MAFVQRLVKEGERVLMVGDGTNDAPALSSATVGIALASGGGGIAAEAADAVILADDPTRMTEAIAISRRTLRLARQSIWAGLGLSGVGHARGQPRLHPAGGRRAAPGRHRRGGDPQRAARRVFAQRSWNPRRVTVTRKGR